MSEKERKIVIGLFSLMAILLIWKYGIMLGLQTVGALFFIFSPGWIWGKFFFPSSKINGLDRVILSAGFSAIALPIYFFIINAIGFPIDRKTAIIALILLIGSGILLYFFKIYPKANDV